MIVFEQILNGLQFGITLFLISAGLTLIFGVMGVINLSHGSLYMIGAYAAALIVSHTGSEAWRWRPRAVSQSRWPWCGGCMIATPSIRCWRPSR
jgi:branched-subunit amino acid ABC-type transport system permease component